MPRRHKHQQPVQLCVRVRPSSRSGAAAKKVGERTNESERLPPSSVQPPQAWLLPTRAPLVPPSSSRPVTCDACAWRPQVRLSSTFCRQHVPTVQCDPAQAPCRRHTALQKQRVCCVAFSRRSRPLSPDYSWLCCVGSGRDDLCGGQRARPHAAVLRPAVPVSRDV